MARTEVTGKQIKDSSVDLTVDVTGVLPVSKGGSGSDTLPINNVLLGNGSGALQAVAPGVAGTVLASDGTTWVSTVIAGAGDVVSDTSTTVDSEVALFSGTGGKTLKRATGTGLATLDSGVLGTVAAPTGAVVGTTDTQTLTSKTLTSPRINALADTNGATVLSISATASSANYFQIVPGAAGGFSTNLYVVGSDSAVTGNLWSKGSGSWQMRSSTNGVMFAASNVASGVNYARVTNAAAGNSVTLDAAGTDTDIGLNLVSKGTGVVQVNGVPVVTTTGAQSLSSKTLTAPTLTGTSVFSQGGIAEWYNTADQTTNYERVSARWTSNVFYLAAEQGGTGSARAVQIYGAAGSFLTLAANGATLGRITSNTLNAVTASGSFNRADSVQVGLNVSTTLAQSGTAGYTGLQINATETTVGSGTKRLIDARVGGVSQFSVDNTGKTVLSSGASLEAYNTTDQTTNTEKGILRWNSNVLEIGTLFTGTGASRSIRIGAGATAGNNTLTRRFEINSALPFYQFTSNTSGAGSIFQITGNPFNASSGLQNFLVVDPFINQSGTAGYTGLLINPTETTVGSGAKKLIDAQVGGVSKFIVDNTGTVTATLTNATGLPVTGVAATGTPSSSTYLRGDGAWQATKYAALIGDGTATTITVTHDLGTRDVVPSVYDAATYEVVECDMVLTSATMLTLTFATAPASNAYRVVVVA